MTLASMTGFSGIDGSVDGLRWRWELRSVNGRGLDIRTRLGSGWDRLEPPLRARLQSELTRGSVSVNLNVQREAATGSISVNEAALAAVLEAALELADRAGLKPPTPEGLLALRGVLETEEQTPAGPDEETEAALLETFEAALAGLVQARQAEGARLREVIEGQLDRIAELARQAAANPARTPEAIRRRLATQVEALTAASSTLDPQRLHQEAAVLATKADIQEELDRLDAHISSARELLAAGGAVGRRLDFLAQEFGRESNTLCSKSNDVSLTAIGLELKVVVDQLREQVQNLA